MNTPPQLTTSELLADILVDKSFEPTTRSTLMGPPFAADSALSEPGTHVPRACRDASGQEPGGWGVQGSLTIDTLCLG